jgi:hypothetical protein
MPIERGLSGEVFTPPVRGPVSPLPAEPSLILVTPRNPMGQRIVFSGPRQLNRAAQELGQRADVQILPGNASPGEVMRASRRLANEVPAGAPITRRRPDGGQVTPRKTQRQLADSLDPEDLNAQLRSLRSIENTIRNITPGPRPNSPANMRLRTLNEQAQKLRDAIRATQTDALPNELDIPGVIRREPVTRISPSTQTMLPEGFTRPAGIAPSTRTQAPFQRPAGIPIEASTPEEAARLRALVRESQQAKNAMIDSAIPDGSKSPPVTDEVTVPPAGSSHMPSV